MDSIVNYYDELGLQRDMSVVEINNKLNQLQAVWNQRIINEPEKAASVLSLIEKAKEIFSTDESKSKYDNDLKVATSKTPKDCTNDTRRTNFEKWYKQALEYFDNNQYDLAKAAIEKAASYYDSADENAEYLADAADIYRYNKEYQTAFKLINDAIILAPRNPYYYLIKATAFLELSKFQEASECYLKAIEIARADSDNENECKGQTFLAYALYYGKDYVAAEVAATKAIELGDTTGMGKKILDELNKPIQMDVSNLYDCLYRKYSSEQCTLADEINHATEKVLSNIKCLGISYQTISNRNIDLTYPSDDIRYSCEYSIVLESSGVWCLYGQIHMRTEDTRMRVGDENTRKVYASYPNLSDDLLREFDFEGSVSFSDRHDFGLIEKLESFDSFPLPYKQTKLTRLSLKKGGGLLKRLNEIINEQETLIQKIEKERDAEIEKQKQEYARRVEAEKRAQNWRAQGKCQYCGGEFKGLFSKKCSSCGRAKDY